MKKNAVSYHEGNILKSCTNIVTIAAQDDDSLTNQLAIVPLTD